MKQKTYASIACGGTLPDLPASRSGILAGRYRTTGVGMQVIAVRGGTRANWRAVGKMTIALSLTAGNGKVAFTN